MTQKKLPLINAAHGSDTRNIINEIIKTINDRGLEILSESSFLNWLDKNGVKVLGEWDDTKEYDRFSVVLHEGNSYTSKKRTPPGIDILNEEFWVLTGNYNAQVDNLSSSVNSLKDEKHNILKEDKTFNIGVDGDFHTLNEAIEFLTEYTPKYLKRGIRVTLNLLSGFIMREQVLVNGLELKWINITSDDDVVAVERDKLTQSFSGYPLFGASKGSLPEINTTFEMDNSGDATDRHGYYCRENATGTIVSGGFINSGGHGVYAEFSGSIEIRDGDFSNSKSSGIVARHSGVIQARMMTKGLTALNCGEHGIRAEFNARIHARNANVSNAGRNGVHCSDSSSVEFATVTANDCGVMAFSVDRGSKINCGRHGEGMRAGLNAVWAVDSEITFSETSIFTDCTDSAIRLDASKAIFKDCNFSNSGRHGAYIFNGSTMTAPNSNGVNSVQNGFLVESGSYLTAENCNVKNAGNSGIIINGSKAFLNGADLSGADNYGVLASNSSIVSMLNANARKGATDDPTDIRATRGSFISATESTGGLYTPQNEMSHEGIIFK